MNASYSIRRHNKIKMTKIAFIETLVKESYRKLNGEVINLTRFNWSEEVENLDWLIREAILIVHKRRQILIS